MTKNNNFCAVIWLHLSVIWWTDCLNNYFLYNVSLMPCLLQPLIREGAVAALRAALTVTSQREGKASQTFQWYKVSIVSLNTLGTVFTKALMHTTLRLHYNAVSEWLSNIFPVLYVWKYQQTIAIYTMQAVKIVLPVHFLAKFDTRKSSPRQCQGVTRYTALTKLGIMCNWKMIEQLLFTI